MTPSFGRFLLVGALLLPVAAAEGGDVIAFVAAASPTGNWSRGYGAALSSTWFQVLSFEGEAARIPGERTDTTMTTFTGSALLAPPIGFLVPYGGVGVGVFQQTVGGENDRGTLRAFVLGAKLKLGLLVLKGEYRNLQLSGDPLLAMDRRISAGAGISF